MPDLLHITPNLDLPLEDLRVPQGSTEFTNSILRVRNCQLIAVVLM